MKNKIMSLLSLCMAVVMCCMSSLPAFAADVTSEETPTTGVVNAEEALLAGIDASVLDEFAEDIGDQDVRIVGAYSSEDGIMPLYEQEGIFYKENVFIQNTLTNVNYTVYPTKNSTLRIWIKSNGPVTLQVRHTGLINYPLDYRESFGAGERDVEVINKCTKDNYLVQISSPEHITFSILVYEQRW